ncbi:MAG: prepilin-type N-terminal cleavage/methylation domain-containing protein [Labilithrix sp.]|nr:prepilin-type N-terminal cleavage/methylation domain-containing protein [Labilithrix sp.]
MLHALAVTPIQRARARQARGFTLVELAVVVTIVGVLAVIAVVGYRRYVLRAKISEAQEVVSAIKIAQEDHRAERGAYANIGPTYCPAAAGVSNLKVGWDPGCSGGVATWTALPVHVAGAVQFAYATTAGTGAFTAPDDTTWVTWGSPEPQHWYTVLARCDLDPGGEVTMLVASSFQNTIFSHNEGQ